MDPSDVIKALKKLRSEKGYSLNTLAKRSGLSKGYLSKIENAVNVPTITTMHRIAKALEVDLTYFFSNNGTDDKKGNMVSVRKHQRTEVSIEIPESGIRRRWPLADQKYDRRMDPYIIEIPADVSKLYQFDGQEFYFLLEGKVEFNYGGERYIYEAGDSIYIDCNVPYYGKSLGEKPAKALLVVYHFKK
jgi:transcriptional regulator with XRE-family HTH domain